MLNIGTAEDKGHLLSTKVIFLISDLESELCFVGFIVDECDLLRSVDF